ncbi:MAG: AzlC family ABC transporter permease [Dysosmobacter sp.]
MQSSPSSWRSALRAAFPHTVPILAGFLVLGATYGMLMQAIGYGPLWSGLFSAIAFGGSTQYAAVPLLAAGFDPLEVFLLSLTISARHLFYSVSMLKKYDDLGWKRWMLYYTLCDETFLRGLHRGAAGGRGCRKILSSALCWTGATGSWPPCWEAYWAAWRPSTSPAWISP